MALNQLKQSLRIILSNDGGAGDLGRLPTPKGGGGRSTKKVRLCEVKDINLNEGDVITKLDDEISSISFSKRLGIELCEELEEVDQELLWKQKSMINWLMMENGAIMRTFKYLYIVDGYWSGLEEIPTNRVLDLGKCLGVTCDTFLFIIDKVKKRLSGWDSKLLSMARHVTLAKSVLLCISNYLMQIALFPIHACNEVEE
ncbi:hypothetical protein Gotri_002175 [Gossypium trilobum]|uniref:Uncharacterized protein n=1 Tax=Gossypium trilobum TaxID=34281 RepID=A0A7J9F8E1_9ROSI|nr:hypothetical protein [Gossypium trilobum]